MELTVEVTYDGDKFEGRYTPLTTAQKKIKQEFQDLFPKLEWLASLKKLVLNKFGRFTTHEEFGYSVRSLLLEDLFDWFFEYERTRSSLECFWIQDFLTPTFFDSHLLNDSALKSYYVKIEEDEDPNEAYSRFCNIEHLAGVDITIPLAKLTNLKHFRSKSSFIDGDGDEEEAQQRKVRRDILYIIFF